MEAKFAYIWEYSVRPEAVEEFLEAYGPEGSWVRLFGRSEGHVRTDLVRDEQDPTRFLTIDYWASRSDRDSFRQKYSKEFETLDRECESFTEVEHFIGDFEVLGGNLKFNEPAI